MQEYKVCIKCNIQKPNTIEYFETKRNVCKMCRKEANIARINSDKARDFIWYKCKIMAYDAYSRVYAKSRAYKKSYRNLTEPYGFANPLEMARFLYDNFKNDIELILQNNDKPSVDRINSTLGYTKDNIKIIDFKANTLLGVEKTKRKVEMICPTGEKIIFNSVTSCIKYFGYKSYQTNKVASWVRKDGLYKIPDGYYFNYLDRGK